MNIRIVFVAPVKYSEYNRFKIKALPVYSVVMFVNKIIYISNILYIFQIASYALYCVLRCAFSKIDKNKLQMITNSFFLELVKKKRLKIENFDTDTTLKNDFNFLGCRWFTFFCSQSLAINVTNTSCHAIRYETKEKYDN